MLAARFYRAISNARAGSGEPPGYALEGRVIVRFAIPALIYMMGNNVMFLALRYLDAPTYQVLGNTKIIVVAVIQRMALGSRKTVVQWCAAAPLSLTPPAAPPPLVSCRLAAASISSSISIGANGGDQLSRLCVMLSGWVLGC